MKFSMYKYGECFTILGIAFVIVLGMLLDAINYFGYPIISIKNLGSYTQVVIQVQATCAALGLTVVTLLGNVMKERILGIGIADFIMNKQRKILNQKNAIISCIVLVFASIFSYLFDWYNVIFSFFVCTLIIIVYMFLMICQIFQDEGMLTDQIKTYIYNHIEKNEIVDLFYSSPVKDRENLKGNRLVVYKDVFVKRWEHVCTRITENNISGVNERIFRDTVTGQSKALRTLFQSKDKEQYAAGLELLDNIYKKYNELRIIRNEKTELNVFFDVYETLIYNIAFFDETDAMKVLFFIPYKVFKSSFYQVAGAANNAGCIITKDGKSIDDYYGYLIYYLRDKRTNGIDYALKHVLLRHGSEWTDILNHSSVQSNEVRTVACNIFVRYLLSLLQNGYIEIIQEGYIDTHIVSGYYRQSSSEMEIALSFLSFFLYAAYNEDEGLLNKEAPELGENCRNLWRENVYKFEQYLRNVYENFDMNAEIVDGIYRKLRNYEIQPRSGAKRLIMEESVREFILLTMALYSNGSNRIEASYGQIIVEDQYFVYYEHFCKERVKERIVHELTCLYCGNLQKTADISDVNESERKNIDIAYNMLVEKISNLYARKVLHDVKEENSSLDMGKEEEALWYLIYNHIKKLFANLGCISIQDKVSSKTLEDNNIIKTNDIHVMLMRATMPSKFVQADSIINHISQILDANLVEIIRIRLLKEKYVEVNQIPKGSDSLKMYMEQKDNQFDTVIGTKNSWMGCPQNDYSEYKEWIDSVHSLLIYGIGYDKYLINLDSNKISILLSDISVIIREYTTEEAEKELKQENGAYKVNVTNDIWLKYSKDVAIDYIKKSKKAIEISGKMRISVRNGNVGKYTEFI